MLSRPARSGACLRRCINTNRTRMATGSQVPGTTLGRKMAGRAMQAARMASAAAGFNLFPACPLDARQKGAKAGVGRDARCVRVCVCVCLCLQVHRMCVSVVFGILLCEASHARCTRCGRAGVLSLAKEAALDASIVTPFTSLVFVVNSTGSGLRCNSSATGAASAPPRPYTHACVHTLCSSLRNTSATGVALRWLLASSRVRAYPC